MNKSKANPQAKHTPGPWILGPNGLDVRDQKHEDEIVSLKYVDHISSETMEANARLIAAAPELLDALREFDEACAIKSLQGTKSVLGITELNRLWETAKAAISKAEGRG